MIRVCPRNPSRMRRPLALRVITESAIIFLDNLAPSARLSRLGRGNGLPRPEMANSPSQHFGGSVRRLGSPVKREEENR